MKTYTTSINKMITSFDKELKSLIEDDLKHAKLSKQALIKSIDIDAVNNTQLKIA
jgi:hypothetical protein